MGGNALQVPVRRMNRDEFLAAQEHVQKVLAHELGLKSFEIPAFRQKETFGDIDLIVERDRQLCEDGVVRFVYEDLADIARTHFHARDFAPNTNMLSFDYHPSAESEGFQIDLIQIAPEFIRTSVAYYSYNDLGNFIGRIAHKMGVKFGHEGLLYLFRDGNYLFRTLTVSQDNDAILNCLGYDPKRYNQGFDNLQEIFEFAASSKYFNEDLYLLENRNHKARTRDRKRANYNAFLSYVAENDLPQYEHTDEDKSQWLPHLFSHFPEFKRDFEITERDFKTNQLFKQFFNGQVLSQATGLQGKELGAFMGAFKQHLGDDLIDLVHKQNAQAIQQKAQDFLKDYRSTKPFKI